jgi:hypothetical protein
LTTLRDRYGQPITALIRCDRANQRDNVHSLQQTINSSVKRDFNQVQSVAGETAATRFDIRDGLLAFLLHFNQPLTPRSASPRTPSLGRVYFQSTTSRGNAKVFGNTRRHADRQVTYRLTRLQSPPSTVRRAPTAAAKNRRAAAVARRLAFRQPNRAACVLAPRILATATVGRPNDRAGA